MTAHTDIADTTTTAPAADAAARAETIAAAPAATPRRRRSPAARRRAFWIGGAAATVVLLAVALRPSPIDVQTAIVGTGPLETTVDADGTTRVVERFEVAAPVGGHLDRIAIREGDAVDAGAPLARIVPLPLDPRSSEQARARVGMAAALLQEAEARVAQSASAQAQAERTAERIRRVAVEGGLSTETLERAELEMQLAQRDHQAARSRVRAATAELSAARAALLDGSTARSAVVVVAPAAGRVLRVYRTSETAVAAGTPLVEIGDAATLEIVTDVLSTDAVRIREGAPVRVRDWGGDGVLDARVRRVEPAGFTKLSALGVEEQRVNVVAELHAVPPGLGDGFRVRAQIVTWARPEVLRVPVATLFRTGEDWSVFVADGGRARQRAVRIGARGAEQAEVLSGLGAGEAVILFPSDQVHDGARIHVAPR
jgi:HlyD family secretion protein